MILRIDGAGEDRSEFTAIMTDHTTNAVICSDEEIGHATCEFGDTTAGKHVAADITITFSPTTTGKATAWLNQEDESTGETEQLAVLTGVGSYERAEKGGWGCANAWSDCDLKSGVGFSLLGGLEQSYLSSEQDQTNGFIRADTSVLVPGVLGGTFSPWAVIRDLGAPQSNSNSNIVSAISNPDGTITNSSLSTVGYSLDFKAGIGLDYPVMHTDHQYSAGPIAAVGFTTPLSSSSATVGYQVPAFGSQECQELQQRFVGRPGYSPLLQDGTPMTTTVNGTATTTTPCLQYTAKGASTATAVNTLAFAGINRPTFLDKWEVGMRTIYRGHTTATQQTCDRQNPCQRGVVDLVLGQDAAIRGGHARHFVFKIEGTQPFPYTGGYLYIFGTAAIRIDDRGSNLDPLILVPATSDTLQKIPSDPSIFIEPYMQPDKDFYRIGVGINFDRIFPAKKSGS